MVGLVAITQMLNQGGSAETYVKGFNKIHDEQSIATLLLFSDFVISSLIVTFVD
jgi:hypothetical protein